MFQKHWVPWKYFSSPLPINFPFSTLSRNIKRLATYLSNAISRHLSSPLHGESVYRTEETLSCHNFNCGHKSGGGGARCPDNRQMCVSEDNILNPQLAPVWLDALVIRGGGDRIIIITSQEQIGSGIRRHLNQASSLLIFAAAAGATHRLLCGLASCGGSQSHSIVVAQIRAGQFPGVHSLWSF